MTYLILHGLQVVLTTVVYEGEETPISFESTVSSRTKSRPQNKNMVKAAPTVVRRVAGLFATSSEQAKISNWKAKQQVLKGGINHQHPHCDNAIVNTYANLDVCPFVCIHVDTSVAHVYR